MQKESLLSTTLASSHLPLPAISAEDAAREKAISGENRAVEHIAELSREQAMKAISVTPSPSEAKKRKKGRRGRDEKDDEAGVEKRKSTRSKLLHDNTDDGSK